MIKDENEKVHKRIMKGVFGGKRESPYGSYTKKEIKEKNSKISQKKALDKKMK